MNETYRNNYPAARYDIIELDRWPVGRIVSEVQTDWVYYVDFALLPQAQGLGIGTTAIGRGIGRAASAGPAGAAALVLV